MTQFTKADRPELNTVVFFISDQKGHTAELTPAEAYTLLEWLYQQRAELHQLAHPELLEQPTPAWVRDLPEWVRGAEEQSTEEDEARGKNENLL